MRHLDRAVHAPPGAGPHAARPRVSPLQTAGGATLGDTPWAVSRGNVTNDARACAGRGQLRRCLIRTASMRFWRTDSTRIE